MKNIIKSIVFTLIVISNSYGANTILFLGDSLTEGHGLSKESSYPSIIEKTLISKGYKGIKVLNGGVSGSTTASGVSRLRWFLKAKPNILVIALGANDGLRGTKIEETKKNLINTIQLAQKNKLKIIICGMILPPNYGKKYQKQFSTLFVDLAKEYKLKIIPFLLKGVGGIKSLNLSDGIHPNEEGYKIVAQNVLSVLEKEL
jgi:acyl-CoA thioesterase-1